MHKGLAFAAAVLCATAGPVFADIVIEDAYARAASPAAKAGAAFMVIRNTGETDDRLIAAEAEISMRVELHTHVETADGVMQMREVEDGFVVPAGSGRVLQRGGDHVMFMGLKGPMEQGATVPVTLIFENAGAVEVEIPVDLNR